MSIEHKISIVLLIPLLICGCQKSIDKPLSKQQCRFANFVNDPNVPQIAKDIYLGNDFNLNNDEAALALFDSIGSGNKYIRKFYFKVVLNSSKKADGYYSEELSEAVADFTKSYTKDFVSYFDDKECFDDKDLETVSDLVLGEFEVLSENGYDKSIIDAYRIRLKGNCQGCSITQMATIEKFIGMLNAEWETQ